MEMENWFATWPKSERYHKFPRFSLKERDRRWRRVRELMVGKKIDCLLVPGARAAEDHANARYLSQMGSPYGAPWVVFPGAGEVTAIMGTARDIKQWSQLSNWISDLRHGRESAVIAIERLKELGLKGSVVGVTDLSGCHRNPGGIFSYEDFRRIQEALPETRFVPNNDTLELARMVKGTEELEVIEHIVYANEKAIQAMFEVARPGVELAKVWLAVTTTMIQMTGDYPARVSIAADSAANTTIGLPIPEPIREGAVLSQELCARLQGYRAQCNHSFVVGRPCSEEYRRAMMAATEIYHALLEWIKPGRTIGDLVDEYERLASERRVSVSGVVVHTNGLGNDRPRVGPSVPKPEDRALVIEPGFTFTIKPAPKLTDSGQYAEVGDPLTVNETGARRLGKRKLEAIVVG